MANVGKHTYRTWILWVQKNLSANGKTQIFCWQNSPQQPPAFWQGSFFMGPISVGGIKQTGSSTIKHPWPIPKQTAAMPLSEPMKAAIVLAIVMAVVAAVLAMVAAVVATYAGVGGFAGGFFEDLVQVLKETACDLVRVILSTANRLKNHLPLIAGATAFALSLPSWGCKTWEPRKCRFTAVPSTRSTDSGWDRHTDGEKKSVGGIKQSANAWWKSQGFPLIKGCLVWVGMIMAPLWTNFNQEMIKWLQKIGVTLPVLQTRQVADQAYRIEVHGRAGRRIDSMTTPHERSRWGFFHGVNTNDMN